MLSKSEYTAFFYSLDGINKSGNVIMYLNGLIDMKSPELESFLKQPFETLLEIAQESNQDITHVNVKSLNKI